MAEGLRILYIITDLNYGGAEKQLELLVGGMKSDARIMVAGLKGWGETAERLHRQGIAVWTKNESRLAPGPQSGWKGLIEIARQFHPDIIHTFLFKANISGRVLSRLIKPRPKVISSVRVWDNRAAPLALERATARWCDCIVFNSFWVADCYSQVTYLDPWKKRVIANALSREFAKSPQFQMRRETRAELGIGPDEFFILGAGRLDRQKGFEYLIKAFALAATKIFHTKLLIAGDGPLKNSIGLAISKSGLTSKIRLLGYQPDAARLMASCDVFILPSLWEGSPNVVLEAWNAGAPVIATSVCGTPELIEDGRNGLLVPPADASRLAEAIVKLAVDPALGKKLAAAGKDCLKNHRLGEILDQYKALYKEFFKVC
ncbi:MAG: glycosyltransferase [Elusimicrobia bacterium]|nr:glycosyltransferase [Elusimicrobiota bacterium]